MALPHISCTNLIRFMIGTMQKALCLLMIAVLAGNTFGGIAITRSNGITLTGADGVRFVGTSGITLTGADGFLSRQSNGITLTGADGITLTGADGIALTGADGVTYSGPNGITLTGADGITLTGADGITLTGVDGITLTGVDGTQYHADTIVVRRPDGITLTGADGITLTGVDGLLVTGASGVRSLGPNGITLTGADGITLTGADGITLTGADGITLTGADGATGLGPNGVLFDLQHLSGITLTGADGITLTGADGIALTGADGITLTGVDGIALTGVDQAGSGLQSVDPELAMQLNEATDDSNFNAIVVYHRGITQEDLAQLQQLGIPGGTRFRHLPVVYVSATRQQLIAVSQLVAVRSIYGNRTLTFDADPYLNPTGVQKVSGDSDLRARNGSLPVTGRNVTVAVLDTGINAGHPDLAGRVVQNVRMADIQSAPAGFNYPAAIENLANTDVAGGHGTFVGGLVAGTGDRSAGRYAGVATGAKLYGVSVGDVSLVHVLAGFDHILERGPANSVKVVNCSFSANTVYDEHDPVNVATKILTERGVSVVFSAGNSGPGNGTLNPYAQSPWVVSVAATDEAGRLASFSSRGSFGDALQHPTLAAPGVNIIGLRGVGTVTGTAGLAGADLQRLTAAELPYYTTASGTSFSAPQAAGAIALMLEADPTLTPAEIKDILSRTATPLPKYFYHEAGAGMLNTYAAVLEAAFPDRRMGMFRSLLSRNAVRFSTHIARTFAPSVDPGYPAGIEFTLPDSTVQASISIAWGLSANDMGLRVYRGQTLAGESNFLNLPGFTGRREKVVLRAPEPQIYRAEVSNSGSMGTTQQVFGTVEVTRAEIPSMVDISGISPLQLSSLEQAILANLMVPQGRRFQPNAAVTRVELAESFVRSGLVTQYVAGSPMFTDVRDPMTRNAVESAQSANLRTFYDAVPGGKFFPYNSATRLVFAVALIRALGLESQAGSATLNPAISDALTIPSEYRGHAAIALQRGFLSLENNRLNPARSVTRLELANALSIAALQ
jgi:serine protease AprX